MVLLDTDIVICNLKGNATVKTHPQTHLNDSIRISAVKLMALYYGVYTPRIQAPLLMAGRAEMQAMA